MSGTYNIVARVIFSCALGSGFAAKVLRRLYPSWPSRRFLRRLIIKCYDKSNLSGSARAVCLSGAEWASALALDSLADEMISRLNADQLSDWGKQIELHTAHGETVLEVGSGTGEISLHLAQVGREVTALDVARQALDFIGECAKAIGVAVRTVQADATCTLPFRDSAFDCVWSSGLLEHFTPELRRNMIREQARVSERKVICLVPNANCVAYRAGRFLQEQQGTWPYGIETPLVSLREDFEAVGLHVDEELTVGVSHALSFLPPGSCLGRAVRCWLDTLSPQELASSDQGYLVLTVGTKSPRDTLADGSSVNA